MGAEAARRPHEDGSPPAARVFLKDEAYAAIKDHLLATEGVDHALSERALAARLGLGLGPVRSALERLRAEALIAVAPNSGIRLPDITAEEIISFYEFRLVMEPYIAATLAGRLTRAQTAVIEGIIAEQERAAAEEDTLRYHRLDLDFHAALAAFHNNAEMVSALGRLRDRMYRLSRRMHRAHPERLAPNAAQHRSIMEAVRDGDGPRARAEMERHLAWGRSFTLDPDGRVEPHG